MLVIMNLVIVTTGGGNLSLSLEMSGPAEQKNFGRTSALNWA